MSRASANVGVNSARVDCDVCSGRGPIVRPRGELLNELVIGDVIEVETRRGDRGLLYLITSVESAAIHARRLLVREHAVFSRLTGEEITEGNEANSSIKSIKPLPIELYNSVLWLDRKFRLMSGALDAKLTTAEIEALLLISDHHDANPL